MKADDPLMLQSMKVARRYHRNNPPKIDTDWMSATNDWQKRHADTMKAPAQPKHHNGRSPEDIAISKYKPT